MSGNPAGCFENAAAFSLVERLAEVDVHDRYPALISM